LTGGAFARAVGLEPKGLLTSVNVTYSATSYLIVPSRGGAELEAAETVTIPAARIKHDGSKATCGNVLSASDTRDGGT